MAAGEGIFPLALVKCLVQLTSNVTLEESSLFKQQLLLTLLQTRIAYLCETLKELAIK